MLTTKVKGSQPRGVVCRGEVDRCDDLDRLLSHAWLRIGLAAVFAGQGMVFSLALNMTPPPFGSTPYWVLHGGLILSALAVMAFLGGPLFASTFAMLRNGRFSIEGLFTLSLLGAFAGSVAGSITGQGDVFYEIVAIVIAIYTFGRMLGERSQEKMRIESDRVRESLDTADKVEADGQVSKVALAAVQTGDCVRVNPGCPFTVDGRIVSGTGFVQETALTGEPSPVARHPGESVRAGTYAVDGSFEVAVAASGGEREIDRILDLVESSTGEPSDLQAQANRLTQYFLPLVASVSAGTAVFWFFQAGWQQAVFNSMAVLLVACPCALGLATPVAIWNGLYRMSQMGLVSRDGSFIDALARTRHVYFDKTGTLSETNMEVTECFLGKNWQDVRGHMLACLGELEERMRHPVAAGIAAYCRREAVDGIVPSNRNVVVYPGQGIAAEAQVGGRLVSLALGDFDWDPEGCRRGKEALLTKRGKQVPIFCDRQFAGFFVLRERFRHGVPGVLDALRQLGLGLTVVTGDPKPEVTLPADIPVLAGLSAEAKADHLRAAGERDECPLLVGDGLNDAAAMALSGASISMVSGAGLTRSAASAQLLDDRIGAIPEAIRLARRIYARIRGNLVYAALYNVVGMVLAAMGWLHPVAAALIMLVSSFLVTMRVLRAG